MGELADLGWAVDQYINAGAGTDEDLRRNEAMWQHWAIVPRVFRDHSRLDTEFELLGRTLRAPLLAAPWGNHGLLHPAGEVETASGVASAGAGMVLSSASSRTIEDVSTTGVPLLAQLYLPADRRLVMPYLEHARQAGVLAIMLTVDAPGITDGASFRAELKRRVNLVHPNWPDGMVPNSAPDLGAHDIEWLAEQAGLPVFVKGILSPDDALIAIDAGAIGVIVSNHGGRQLAGSLTAAEALPAVADAVAGRGLVLVDGGIRDAEDVFRALALGADAVMLGRPVAWALAAGGGPSVHQLFAQLADDLKIVLACCGACVLDSIEKQMVMARS